MKVLMLAQSPVAGDTRIIREATALMESGHEVVVIGRAVPATFKAPEGLLVLSVGKAAGLRPARAATSRDGVLSAGKRAARWLLLPEHRSRVERAWRKRAMQLALAQRADVVHAHDFNTLELAAEVVGRTGARLVYDSHEMWSGRPRVGRPTPVRRRLDARVERRVGATADVVLTVGDGVAAALRAAYGWQHVQVVRNTFPEMAPAPPEPPSPRGLVYAGRLAQDRELEVIAQASHLIDLPVTIVGPADARWLQGFEPGRAQLRPSLPLDGVDELLLDAGIALVTHSDRWVNHRLAMPNKLFHAVRVGVPVVATDVGELGRTVRQYGLGVLYRPGDFRGLATAVKDLTTGYQGYVAAVRRSREVLSWKTDRQVLVDVYARLAVGSG